jgi:hypothetical protein
MKWLKGFLLDKINVVLTTIIDLLYVYDNKQACINK